MTVLKFPEPLLKPQASKCFAVLDLYGADPDLGSLYDVAEMALRAAGHKVESNRRPGLAKRKVESNRQAAADGLFLAWCALGLMLGMSRETTAMTAGVEEGWSDP